MSIESSLIESIAADVYGTRPASGRAKDIAREVDGLVTGLGVVLPVDFLEEPDSFRAALWSLAPADDDGN